MRSLLILGGIGILSTAAWTTPLGAEEPGQGSGRGSGGVGHSGMEVPRGRLGAQPPLTHAEPHSDYVWLILLNQMALRSNLIPGEAVPGPVPPGVVSSGLVVGAPEHILPGHLISQAIHPYAYLEDRSKHGEAVLSQPAVAVAGESDQTAAPTAQPSPTASPSSWRPPGATGPGQPVSGWSGPGLPGPGRSGRPR
jgi:hypothetical protein